MDEWVFWAVTMGIGILIAALGYFIKRQYDDIQKGIQSVRDAARDAEKRHRESESEQNKRIEKMEMRMQELTDTMPMKYTLKDDFIRAMSGVEGKLNKILDKLSGLNGGK